MRIALIDPSLFTWPYDATLALALEARGHEVAIFGKPIDPKEAGPAYRLLRPHFYRLLDSDLARRLPHAAFLGVKGVLHVAEMRRLLEELRDFRPDIIHVQWSPLPIVDRWFIAALRAIAPLVMTVHDPVPYNGSPRSLLQRLSAVAIMGRFARLIVHTNKAAARLREYGLPAENIRRIPHGPMGLAPVLESAVLPQRQPGTALEILLFGRLKPYKGVETLVRAAAAMRPESLRKCRIRIIGKPFMDLGPAEQLIAQHGLAQHVQIEPRFVAEAEVAELFASADVIALPYTEIDASGVLMSSLTAGVPIVATRIGLFAEMLEDGKHGRLIDVGDHRALAHALEELADEPELRARMGAEVRRLRDAIPDWATIAGMTEGLYRELLGTGGARPLADRPDLRQEYVKEGA
ncbi:MAG TPA: glycosyltransferase family 4 protein [Polyangiales bacterium]|nr:glycosyltransferase family 4 protein [Polyangiales bacterium]